MTSDAEPTIELQAAANELGVHYQTAYRWVRNGRLPAKLVGGKYLVAESDIASARAARNAPSEPSPPGAARLGRQAEKMRAALFAGDETEARRIARRLVDEGTGLVALIESVLVPPMRDIGQAWHEGELTIWVEHRASAIVERVLGDLLPNPRGRRRGTAVVAAVSGDFHSLPTTMATVVLRENLWHVHHLGADIPATEIADFCASHDVDIAVISMTNPEVGAEVDRLRSLLADSPTALIVGGAGRTLTDLVEAAQGALAERRGSEL